MFHVSTFGTDLRTKRPVIYDRREPVDIPDLLELILAEFSGGAEGVEITLTAESERGWSRPS